MPRPKAGENKREYISRAIPMLIREGKNIKAAQGKAFGMWDYYKGKKKGRK